MSRGADLRAGAETLAGHLPPLLAEAEHLAQTVVLGDHGRRRAGLGSLFWQYRPAQPTDSARRIDWRRSARTDAHFVQEKEWQIAQTVTLWVDPGASMSFGTGDVTKAGRARLLALALGILLLRGGERVGLGTPACPALPGQGQVNRLAEELHEESGEDYAAPHARAMPSRSRAVFLSDFMGDVTRVEGALTEAADRGVKGALLQVLDPQEEAFPFDGRTIFESMTGALRHETLKAGDLRTRYLDRLAERRERLRRLARRTGWQFQTHRTDESATAALLWLHGAVGGR